MNEYVKDPEYLNSLTDSEPIFSFPISIDLTLPSLKTTELFIICGKMGGERATALAREEAQQMGMPLIPWCGVACPADDRLIPGHIFCFLPLPTQTGLAMHVNGSFELSLNRRDIWSGEDMGGRGKKKALWNRYLQEDIVAPLLAESLNILVRVLSSLFSNLVPLAITSLHLLMLVLSFRLPFPHQQRHKSLETYYDLWPLSSNAGPTWKSTVFHTYKYICERSLPLLKSENPNRSRSLSFSFPLLTPHPHPHLSR